MRTKDGIVGCIVLVVMLTSCWLTWLVGFVQGTKWVRQEAVNMRAARWMIDSQDEPTVTFEWVVTPAPDDFKIVKEVK